MTASDQLVAEVLSAAHGKIVGRVRLQKLFYLLEQKGMSSGLSFSYHYYGPYSRGLDSALDRAQAIQGVREDIEYRQADGMPYSIFSLKEGTQPNAPTSVGRIPMEEARRIVGILMAKSSTVLELAATIHWLINVEQVSDWRAELVRRKGTKTERGRTGEALDLLKRLDLPVGNAFA